jgi:hypothetical protein
MMPAPEDAAHRKRAEMKKELRRQRNACEPKDASNPLYHAFSLAISAINKIDELTACNTEA